MFQFFIAFASLNPKANLSDRFSLSQEWTLWPDSFKDSIAHDVLLITAKMSWCTSFTCTLNMFFDNSLVCPCAHFLLSKDVVTLAH